MTELRPAFDRARDRIVEMQRSGADPDEILRTHADDVDQVVVGAFDRALAERDRTPHGIALVALGGYGRRELAPNSDLDLLLLYRGWTSSDVTSLNRAVMYPLWDSGRELGDRIREPSEVIRTMDEIDEVCALLDARLLAGDRGLFADLEATASRRLERSRASFLAGLDRASRERHERYGHAGHLLEPNIRDSAGGLRDIQTLGWASKALPGGDGIDGLVAAGHLSSIDAHLIWDARTLLSRLRIELHLVTGRHQDQLYLSEQDEAARRLGVEALEGRPAADRLMQQLFLHARQADAVVASFWDRVIHVPRRRFRAARTESIGDGCVIRGGRIEVLGVTNLADDVSGWLRVFRRSVVRDLPVGRTALNRLHTELVDTPRPVWNDEARDLFCDILAAGRAGIRALDEMDIAGLLVALIPEWEPIRAYPQRDLYHRFTVDSHLFAAVAELAASRSLDDRDTRDAWASVGDPDALFMATLFHDVGKGRGGDHSEIGAVIARASAERIGLSPAQTDDVAFLVAEHLTLAETAVRRDLNEPMTITEVASRVGDQRRLAMLYLLTRADSLATGAEAWSSFRASLVRELYSRTKQHLSGAPVTETAPGSSATRSLVEELDLSVDEAATLLGPMPESWAIGVDVEAARRQLALLRTPLGPDEVRAAVRHTNEADEFIVVTADRPGLFSIVAGVLALRGLDVHDAEIYTRSDGIAVEVFRVVGSHGPISDERWSKLSDDIAAAVRGDIDIDEALLKKAAQTRRRRGQQRSTVPWRVVVTNDASETHTVIEVHTSDRFGLLRAITKVLADTGCDLGLAKIATYGVEVVDVFYVRDLEGRKITDADRIRKIEERLGEILTV